MAVPGVAVALACLPPTPSGFVAAGSLSHPLETVFFRSGVAQVTFRLPISL